jgi:hypothetical protein
VTDKAHKGWFAVDGYDIGVTTPFSSAAGTEVTGRTQFSPFCMDYEPFRVRRGWSARRTGR